VRSIASAVQSIESGFGGHDGEIGSQPLGQVVDRINGRARQPPDPNVIEDVNQVHEVSQALVGHQLDKIVVSFRFRTLLAAHRTRSADIHTDARGSSAQHRLKLKPPAAPAAECAAR
jgi:hypothetical protein